MECKTAQLLIEFARPGAGDIDGPDLVDLETHLAQCPACEELARSERLVDDHIGKAMRQVDVPDRLRARLHNRLTLERRNWYRKHLRRAALTLASVAALVLVVWGVWWWRASQLAEVDVEVLWAQANHITEPGFGPREVESYFRRRGYPMIASDDFNYSLLTSFYLKEFQGKQVPQLIFVRPFKEVGRDNQPSADYAQVYFLSSKQFDLRSLAHNLPLDHDYPFNVKVIYRTGESQAVVILFTGKEVLSWLTPENKSAF